jgi:hypothetical protein
MSYLPVAFLFCLSCFACRVFTWWNLDQDWPVVAFGKYSGTSPSKSSHCFRLTLIHIHGGSERLPIVTRDNAVNDFEVAVFTNIRGQFARNLLHNHESLTISPNL